MKEIQLHCHNFSSSCLIISKKSSLSLQLMACKSMVLFFSIKEKLIFCCSIPLLPNLLKFFESRPSCKATISLIANIFLGFSSAFLTQQRLFSSYESFIILYPLLPKNPSYPYFIKLYPIFIFERSILNLGFLLFLIPI